jgi:adenine/guanine phosphoribosyltransferase-like PRPP-binding protein
MAVVSENWAEFKTLNQNSAREFMRMKGERLIEPKLRSTGTLGLTENNRRPAFMTIEESVALAGELGERLRALKPDVIVGIPNGALLIAKVIADQLHLPFHTLLIRRRGSRLKKLFSSIPGLRAFVSMLYHSPIIYSLIDRAMHALDDLATMRQTPHEFPVNGKVVALIDDVILTGQTIAMARQFLLAANAKAVVVACISWETHKDSLAAYNVRPDLFINRRFQSFPWSLDSPHWKEFVFWLNDRGIELE